MKRQKHQGKKTTERKKETETKNGNKTEELRK